MKSFCNILLIAVISHGLISFLCMCCNIVYGEGMDTIFKVTLSINSDSLSTIFLKSYVVGGISGLFFSLEINKFMSSTKFE